MKATIRKIVATSVTVSLLAGFVPPSFAIGGVSQYESTVDSSGIPSLSLYALESPPIDRAHPGVDQQAAPLLWVGTLAIRFSAHALKQAAARGVSHHTVKQVILNGKRTHGNNNTWIYSSGNIRVIVNKTTGNIVTVTKG